MTRKFMTIEEYIKSAIGNNKKARHLKCRMAAAVAYGKEHLYFNNEWIHKTWWDRVYEALVKNEAANE